MTALETRDELRRFADLLTYAADCIDHCYHRALMPDCNNCKKTKEDCEYYPKWGEDVRINCPHWVSEKDGDHS